MKRRRKAREFALQFLYQQDITGNPQQDYKEGLELFWTLHPTETEVKQYTEYIISGTLEHVEEIDSLIKQYSQHWNISRMGIVERNILRLSIFEIRYSQDVPDKVSINEAIEIAKIFGTEDSGRFINGILDRISIKKAYDKSISKESNIQ